MEWVKERRDRRRMAMRWGLCFCLWGFIMIKDSKGKFIIFVYVFTQCTLFIQFNVSILY